MRKSIIFFVKLVAVCVRQGAPRDEGEAGRFHPIRCPLRTDRLFLHKSDHRPLAP